MSLLSQWLGKHRAKVISLNRRHDGGGWQGNYGHPRMKNKKRFARKAENYFLKH